MILLASISFIRYYISPIIIIDLSDKTLGGLLHLVFLTYSRYNDRPSRFAMLNVLKELNNWDSDQFLGSFVPMITKEVDKLNQKSPDGYNNKNDLFLSLYLHCSV